MNKKFSTLVAAFLSLGTFATMNAANVDVNPTAVTDVKGTKYYFLGHFHNGSFANDKA